MDYGISIAVLLITIKLVTCSANNTLKITNFTVNTIGTYVSVQMG